LIALLAAGVILSLAAFTIGWAVCRRIHNYSFLDAIWSLSIGALAALYAVLGSGTLERRAAFGCVGLVWSSRLGIYILIRVMRAHPAEDARYRTLRERWTGPVGFLLFFEIQALIAVVFSLPFLMASVEPALRMGSLEIIGLAGASLQTTRPSQALAGPRYRALALFATSELLLRIVGVVGLFCRGAGFSIRLGDRGVPAAHALLSVAGHGYPFDREAFARIAW
jgi:hypothetical protein